MTQAFVAVAALLLVALLVRAAHVKIRVSGKVSTRDLRPFCRMLNSRTAEYMRANYSGDPAQLEGALRGMLPLAQELASQQTPPIDDRLLRSLVATAVAGNRIARREQVERALDALAAEQRPAA